MRSQNTATPPPARRWASKEQAADYIGVCDKTLRRYIAQGIIPAHRLGKRLIRLDLNEVDAAMARIPSAGDVA